NLEKPASTERFASESNLGAMGFLFDPAVPDNPDGLPIGVVKDSMPSKIDAVGLTCAACHTRDLAVTDAGRAAVRYRIDGRQAARDIERSLRDLEQALVATAGSTTAFDRLSAATGATTTTARNELRDQLSAAINMLSVERLSTLPAGQSVNDPGPGR